ncbi:AraC family transcriptional regulator [Cellulosimicrobium cellulans]|uniref:AraC family transcriptional regulator n=1 Tax=Cellulosimicrobium cellulans TaxID=1710 RepID=UPI001964FA4C|nr:AraC family transcriptional regulator [Cellulosimicrobium cellulans]MBN0038886.1 AraC family transcriptional regulator [Cellulosimicrobium cellulans]
MGRTAPSHAPPPARNAGATTHTLRRKRAPGAALRDAGTTRASGRGQPRMAVLGECVLLAGRLGAIVDSAPAFLGREPATFLVHVGARRAEPAHDGVHSLLLSTGATVPAPDDARIVGLAVPRARVTSTVLAPLTRLAETPLVRASRALLVNLLRDAPLLVGDAVDSVDELLVSLMRGVVHDHPHAVAPHARESTLAARIEALIEARHSDPGLDVVQIARELHTSRRQLYRHVPGTGGVAAMLARRRVETARALLADRPDLSVAQVAARSGFTSASRLREHFVRWHGSTPSEYRLRAGAVRVR